MCFLCKSIFSLPLECSPGGCLLCSLHGEGNPLACACGMRGPSPYVLLSDHITPVGQDRLILTRSGSGDPELQRWARYLPAGRPLASRPGRRADRKKSRPGGFSYRTHRNMKHPRFDTGEGQALALRDGGGGGLKNNPFTIFFLDIFWIFR